VKIIVLTGGPGGGKSSFLRDVQNDTTLAESIVILPEAIQAALGSSIGSRDPLFQRLVVQVQKGLEWAVAEILGDREVILTHRGTLDPLAFCLSLGWTEERFWQITGLRLEEEYQRYYAVIHLVSTAIGASQFYRYRPEEHRPETPQEAAVLDEHLARIWGGHPRYIRIPNDSLDWASKSQMARNALHQLL